MPRKRPASTNAKGKPRAGRPPIIFDTDPKGVLLTEKIIERVRAGAYFENATASVGISRITANNWLRQGAELRNLLGLEDGLLPNGQPAVAANLTKYDLACVAFSEAIDQSRAEWVVGQELELGRIARGGLTKTKTKTVTRRDAHGNVLETVESTEVETLPPDPSVIEWRLERTCPEQYGRRQTIAVGGDPNNDQPVELRVASIIDRFTALGVAAQPDDETAA